MFRKPTALLIVLLAAVCPAVCGGAWAGVHTHDHECGGEPAPHEDGDPCEGYSCFCSGAAVLANGRMLAVAVDALPPTEILILPIHPVVSLRVPVVARGSPPPPDVGHALPLLI